MSQKNPELHSTLPGTTFPRFAIRLQLMLEIYATRTSTQSRSGGIMAKSRREFLADASAGLFGAAVIARAQNQKTAKPSPAASRSATSSPGEQPGTPSAFGTAPAVGPEVSPETFAEAEKLVRIELSEAERAQAAGNWRRSMAALYERRTGPKKVALESTLSPGVALGPRAPRHESRPRARSIYPQHK